MGPSTLDGTFCYLVANIDGNLWEGRKRVSNLDLVMVEKSNINMNSEVGRNGVESLGLGRV